MLSYVEKPWNDYENTQACDSMCIWLLSSGYNVQIKEVMGQIVTSWQVSGLHRAAVYTAYCRCVPNIWQMIPAMLQILYHDTVPSLFSGPLQDGAGQCQIWRGCTLSEHCWKRQLCFHQLCASHSLFHTCGVHRITCRHPLGLPLWGCRPAFWYGNVAFEVIFCFTQFVTDKDSVLIT